VTEGQRLETLARAWVQGNDVHSLLRKRAGWRQEQLGVAFGVFDDCLDLPVPAQGVLDERDGRRMPVEAYMIGFVPSS